MFIMNAVVESPTRRQAHRQLYDDDEEDSINIHFSSLIHTTNIAQFINHNKFTSFFTLPIQIFIYVRCDRVVSALCMFDNKSERS